MASPQASKSPNGNKPSKSEIQSALSAWVEIKSQMEGLAERAKAAAEKIYGLVGEGKILQGPDGEMYRAERKQYYEIDPSTKKRAKGPDGKDVPKGPPTYQVRRLGSLHE